MDEIKRYETDESMLNAYVHWYTKFPYIFITPICCRPNAGAGDGRTVPLETQLRVYLKTVCRLSPCFLRLTRLKAAVTWI